eukprot:COSAG02_NODE_2967_length_7641_cov_10.730708_6_plen_200_part_00
MRGDISGSPELSVFGYYLGTHPAGTIPIEFDQFVHADDTTSDHTRLEKCVRASTYIVHALRRILVVANTVRTYSTRTSSTIHVVATRCVHANCVEWTESVVSARASWTMAQMFYLASPPATEYWVYVGGTHGGAGAVYCLKMDASTGALTGQSSNRPVATLPGGGPWFALSPTGQSLYASVRGGEGPENDEEFWKVDNG